MLIFSASFPSFHFFFDYRKAELFSGQALLLKTLNKLKILFSPEDMVSHMNRENTSTRQNLRLSNIDLAAAKKAAELAAKLGGVQLEDNVFKQKQ